MEMKDTILELRKKKAIEVAAGRKAADLVIKNASFVNVFGNKLSHGDIAISDGIFVGIGDYKGDREIDAEGKIIVPGFIDAHIHLESSLIAPDEFAAAVVPHGTVAVVTDPHEMANVMGTQGIDYMLAVTENLPIDVFFMLPSCVPATPMDENGATLNAPDIEPYYNHPRVLGLAEMMDFGGVVSTSPEVIKKIVSAELRQKAIDGHAPGLCGNELNAYIAAGIGSDHECSELEEAIRKLDRGQRIMIREGTAAHNLDTLLPLLDTEYASRCMFCCDDKHPSDIRSTGHIDHIVRRAIRKGIDPIVAVKAASFNTAQYFAMDNRGAIAPAYVADFMIIDSFDSFNIEAVYKNGKAVYDGEKVCPFSAPQISGELSHAAHNTFYAPELSFADISVAQPRAVIGIVPGELITTDCGSAEDIDVKKDVLKIAVIERHKNTHHIGVGYIHGYGLRSGAVATSISHDSHNIIAVGENDLDICTAVNKVLENKGGIVVANEGKITGEVVLSVAGIMSDEHIETVIEKLEGAKRAAFAQGVSREIDPFMTLSFMALSVIPTLRITTRGVIDVASQKIL